MTTWMVVEDEPDIYEVLLAMYETLGINGVAFSTGEEAVNWIDAVDAGRIQVEVPELAMLDIRLPGQINGPMVGARLRRSPVMGRMAIVLMTAYRLTPEQEEMVVKQARANHLIYKPLPGLRDFEQLMEDIIANRALP